MPIHLKRAYEPPAQGDGTRVLIDRLWPRGLSKASARIDHWLKDLAPSDALRRWFGHDPAKWAEFKRRYFAELKGNRQAISDLRRLSRRGRVTLLYAAKDELHNNAVALAEFLPRRRGPAGKARPRTPRRTPPIDR